MGRAIGGRLEGPNVLSGDCKLMQEVSTEAAQWAPGAWTAAGWRSQERTGHDRSSVVAVNADPDVVRRLGQERLPIDKRGGKRERGRLPRCLAGATHAPKDGATQGFILGQLRFAVPGKPLEAGG